MAGEQPPDQPLNENTDRKVKVRFSNRVFDTTNGDIEYYSVIVSTSSAQLPQNMPERSWAQAQRENLPTYVAIHRCPDFFLRGEGCQDDDSPGSGRRKRQTLNDFAVVEIGKLCVGMVCNSIGLCIVCKLNGLSISYVCSV